MSTCRSHACLAFTTLASLLLAGAASAQNPPRVLVHTSIEPGSVTIGETATLNVDILTDTFFLQAPELPPLAIPGVIAKLADERPLHLTEQVQGTTMFGIRRVYTLTPIAASTFDIPAFEVVAHPGPGANRIPATAPERQLEAIAPPGADGAFVTHDLTLTQEVDADPAALKVGGAITRRIEMSATGTPAMFIPALSAPEIPGLATYPRAPDLRDDASAQLPVGHRIDQVTYVVQQPGDFELPAVNLRWWDLDTRQIRTASLPEVKLRAVAAPATKPVFSVPVDQPATPPKRALDWRMASTLALTLIALLAVIHWSAPVMRRACANLGESLTHRRRRYLDSERYAFSQLCVHLHRRDIRTIPRALYRWLDRLPGYRCVPDEAAQVTTSAGLEQITRSLFAYCYASKRETEPVLPLPTSRRLHQLRREVLRNARRRSSLPALPALNP